MKTANLRTISETIGIVLIVASLVFVGLQLNQSQRIALAEQYQARAEASMSLHLAFQESGTSIAEVLSRIPNEEASNELRNSRANFTNFAWFSFDNHHFQYQSGFLTDEAWEGLSKRIARVYSNCSLRPGWNAMRYSMRKSFVEYVESLPDECVQVTEDA